MNEKSESTDQDTLVTVDEKLIKVLDDVLVHMQEQNAYDKKIIRALLSTSRGMSFLLVVLSALVAVAAYQAVRVERLVRRVEDAQSRLSEVQMEVETTRATVYDTAKKVNKATSVDVVVDDAGEDRLKVIVKPPPDMKTGGGKTPKPVEFSVDLVPSAEVKDKK